MSMLNKVFGIISYFPDNDTAYHIETRRERSRRFRELLFKLEELWPDTDIMIIAQNWQDFELPEIKNKIIRYDYEKLGILGARRELRKQFLESDYDYLIMLDDDGMISTKNPSLYMNEIDKHPNGMGVIRRVGCPLMLLAISKYVYSRIDMPDMDAENDGGFEDDLFVATCFAQLPNHCFDFPEGCVIETSFRYKGEGKCPSTWAGEKKRDWDYLRNFTDRKIYEVQHPELFETQKASEPSIDLIITYVNSADRDWVQSFIRKTKTHNPTAVRFRSWGTLKYLLRGVAEYMPFIRNVVLVVASPTQVPAWLNRENVRVVYHEEFIPKQFLPTFNSCTIESFFWNIPDLADRVIYFNDDMFPIGPMCELDFFTGNTPHIRFKDPESFSKRNIFVSQSRSGMDMITGVLNLPQYEEGKVLLPYHISQAINKNCFEAVKQLCADQIGSTITTIRNPKNLNQYLYAYYQYFTEDYINITVNYRYFEIKDSTFEQIKCRLATEDACQMICLNDSDKIQNYARTRYLLCDAFERKFPVKSRFEI